MKCEKHYNEITDQMKQKINNLVINSYSKYSHLGDRAYYISEEMAKTFDKHKWSCLISNNYGFRFFSISGMKYTYNYKNYDYIVYIGGYSIF